MSPTTCLSVLRFASPTTIEGGGLPPSALPFQRLTDRIIQHFSASNETNDPPSMNVIQISNRYFTAQVALLSEEATQQSTLHKEDGIVLVWDDDHAIADWIQLLNAAHEQLEAAGGGDLLRLCVGISTTTTTTTTTTTRSQRTPKEIEETYSQRVLWCLDRGYEYIPACDLSDEGVSRGHGERDKEGFARLVEAIQGTVWSSAVMATSTQHKLKSAYQETLAAVEQLDQKIENNNDDIDEDRMNQYVPPDPSMLLVSINKEDEEREKKAQEALMKDVNEETTDQSTVSGVQESTQTASHEEGRVNERLFNQFEGAIQEASRIRDLSRSGQLSDEERRQRAGDAAMMLVNLLDQMGYDDDDEDDGNSSIGGEEEKEEKVD
ncbi:hypothetical protein FisN_12Hh258 [Fistulifera solaris]|uniref:Uncharacterized protein n=1 Tax=Fistulifera solaris TaxID=1519565 RepID=A0A1Z5KBL6_FISSO|nr:hypothetical protein FisN_12Hh258 [Fistulifera solaris]|eukprot:GAX23683.1 hypothetical protein FisN_12Hh258 [Fistulifera solaris]